MDEICKNLLDKTTRSFHELLFLEQITFVMFLISFCTIGMFRPVPKKSKEELEKEKQELQDRIKEVKGALQTNGSDVEAEKANDDEDKDKDEGD